MRSLFFTLTFHFQDEAQRFARETFLFCLSFFPFFFFYIFLSVCIFPFIYVFLLYIRPAFLFFNFFFWFPRSD